MNILNIYGLLLYILLCDSEKTIFTSLISNHPTSEYNQIPEYGRRVNNLSNMNDVFGLDIVLCTLLLNYISQNSIFALEMVK